jgi:hypothetical protein
MTIVPVAPGDGEELDEQATAPTRTSGQRGNDMGAL